MTSGRIIIVSGPPGAGKSTIAQRLAGAAPRATAIHLHTDDFYAYIRKGYVEPWRPESRTQNVVVMTALASASAAFACGGYDVLADGIVGPWFFDPWIDVAASQSLDLRYIILLPEEETCVARATARGPGAMTNAETVRFMWGQFRALADMGPHVLDTTHLSVDEAVDVLSAGLSGGQYRLTEDDQPGAT